MSNIAFSFEYKGSKDDAVRQLKDMERKVHEQFPQYEGCWEVIWKDYGGVVDSRVMGMDITGQFDIVERDANGGDVKVLIKLPMLLGMMKGPIETFVKSEIHRMIG